MDNKDLKSFLKSTRQLVRILVYRHKVQESFGTTVVQRHVLLDIGEKKQTTIGDISKELSLNKGNVSKSVQQLAEMGCIERMTSEDDRRYTYISLTEKGRRLYEKIDHTVDNYYQKVFKLIPKEKQSIVIDGFKIFTDAILDYSSKNSISKKYKKE